MGKKILIGVAWPYVNGELHVGHLAGYLIPADICARYNRLIGNEVLMVSGSDCFGTPITVEADKKKVSPSDIVEQYHSFNLNLFNNILKLSYDLYTLTNTSNHIEVTQNFFIAFLEAGLLYVDATLQYYSPTENRFLPDRYVVGECPNCGFKDSRSDQCDTCGKLLAQGELINARSNLLGEPVELKETQHYFIDWPKLQDKLKDYVESHCGNWKEWVAKETLGWLSEGLKPRAITRDLDWGVPIPTDRIPADKQVSGVEHKRIYVWFDAVIGYFSASILWAKEKAKDPEAWKSFWYNSDAKHYYFMGKDNLAFHTLFWPGQLMTYDSNLHLPDVASINMFLNYDGQQFSKSRGFSIPAKDIVEKYGNDAVRFYLTLIMPETKDSSFNWQDFKEKNNGVLVANLGNFINRVLSLAKGNNFTLDVSAVNNAKHDYTNALQRCNNALANCEFRNYLNELLALSSLGNQLVDSKKLWTLEKNSPEFNEAISVLLGYILTLNYLMKPLFFEASEALEKLLGIEEVKDWPAQGSETDFVLDQLGKVKISDSIKPLFRKIEEPTAGL